MDQDKIEKLLRSNNPDDQILGAILALNTFGREWCAKNFTNMTHVDKLYKSTSNIVLDFDKFVIFLGTSFIEYWDDKKGSPYITHPANRGYFSGKIINYNEYKELSESL